MVKTSSIILGVGLVILWIAGLSAVNSTGWLTWLNGVAALCSFAIAGGVSDRSIMGVRVGSVVALSAGLFALWIIGLATGVVAWQSWWTFAFACAYLVLAIASGTIKHKPMGRIEEERERPQDQFRKSA